MKPTLSRHAGLLIAMLALAGCPGEQDPGEGISPGASTPTASSSSSTAPTTLEPEGSGGDRIEARAKTELDGRDPDDSAFAVEGSTTAFEVPIGWRIEADLWKLAQSGDDKERFTAVALAQGETTTAKRAEAAAALSFSDCQWGARTEVRLGKQRLAAKVADGACKRSGRAVGAVYAELTGPSPSVVAVGGWAADGGDPSAVFAIFRTVTGQPGGGGPAGIAACCAALENNAKVAPLQHRGNYLAAAAGCRAVVNDPRGKAALATALAKLRGAKIPPPCQ